MHTLAHYKVVLALLVSRNLVATRLKRAGWTFNVSKGGRGYCRYNIKTITIPKWALDNPEPEYSTYYLMHECAHAMLASIRHKIQPHGPEFMAQLIAICPAHLIHYETEYKSRNAAAAGISSKQQAKPTDLDNDTDYLENLFNL